MIVIFVKSTSQKNDYRITLRPAAGSAVFLNLQLHLGYFRSSSYLIQHSLILFDLRTKSTCAWSVDRKLFLHRDKKKSIYIFIL